MVKLTFNRPSVETLFPPSPVGIVFHLGEDGSIQVEPTADQNAEGLVRGSTQRRGGYQVILDEVEHADILRRLRRRWSAERPFSFLLGRPGGRLAPVGYAGDGDPARTRPHMRLWPPAEAQGAALNAALSPAPLEDHAALVRRASQILKDWHASRRLGRPPREVEEARQIMEEFAALVREVRPILLLEGIVDIASIRRVRDTLLALLPEVDPGNPAVQEAATSTADLE